MALFHDERRRHREAVAAHAQGETGGEAVDHDGRAARTDDAIADVTGKRLPENVVVAAWSRMEFTDDPVVQSLRDSASHAERVGLLARVDLGGLVDLRLLNEARSAQGLPRVAG